MSTSNSFRNQRVLLTGGAGFVGFCLLKRLVASGADVHLILRTEASDWRLRSDLIDLTIHRGDCRIREDMEKILALTAPDLVYHLATPRLRGEDSPATLVSDNVAMAGNLIDLIPRHGNPSLVLTGSSLEYEPKYKPHREDDPLLPVTWHGIGKAFVYRMFQQAARETGIRFSCLRLFHVYGPWESPHRLLGAAIRAALTATPLPVTKGTIRRDWVYIDDVVDACIAAGVSDFSGEVFNIGSGHQYANEDIIGMVERICGCPILRIPGGFEPSSSDSSSRLADISKARKLMDWTPRTSLERGLLSTVEWGKTHTDILFNNKGYRPEHA